MSGIIGFLFLLSGVFVAVILVGVFWSIRSGQFDDLQGPAERILMDEDDPRIPGRHFPPETKKVPSQALDTQDVQ